MNHSNKILKRIGRYNLITKQPIRYFSIIPIFSRILKLRYLFIGSAVGGGIAIQNVSTLSRVCLFEFLF